MYRWEQQEHFPTGVQCGEAANWWQIAEYDFALAEQMGNNALRLSIEWSRIEPAEGQWHSTAVDRYRAMLTDLHSRDLTSLHGTIVVCRPRWPGKRDQYTSLCSLHYTCRTIVVRSLRYWLTINEPNVYAFQGYLFGSYPPGEHDLVHAAGFA